MDAVDLARLQFALTALYHFLFVPLTLGLSFLLAIMESVYVLTQRRIWRDMTQFWGKLFGINFAMGVATGITLEFQFGTNWSFYSYYVGDVFGTPLAVEGFMAFFLEATFVGLFFFGWDRLSQIGHLTTTWLVAIGSNLSALWILVANGWMQNPVGARFNPDTLRMELTSVWELIFNTVAQAKFVHTVGAGYVAGSMFVAAISSYYFLSGRFLPFAKRSLIVASSFGLASALCVVVLGDESGYTVSADQKMKLAAIEAMWHTEPAPAGFYAFGIPDAERQQVRYGLKIPWVLGIIATRSFNQPIPGINELVDQARARILNGVLAFDALERFKRDRNDRVATARINAGAADLGYALLLKRYVDDPRTADAATISKAAADTVPNVAVLFWSFRIMVGLGVYFVVLLALNFWFVSQRRFTSRWLLYFTAWSLPLPWIAAELGWIVSENGRQPWAIDGVLPTFLAVSSVSTAQVLLTLSALIALYTALFVTEVILMCKYVRMGPIKALGLPQAGSRSKAAVGLQQ